ncbi:MAG TPA: hypothetical protein VHB21_08425 [Minicystis sp.]|nr:hypothetical protein [Minicystis sp.]
MKITSVLAAALAAAALAGCAGGFQLGTAGVSFDDNDWRTPDLARRASFDFACAHVETMSVTHDSYGAAGCGKRATYIWVLRDPRLPGGPGTWVLNGPISRDVDAPPPQYAGR